MSIKEMIIPRTDVGNDPNDHRNDQDFMDKLEPTKGLQIQANINKSSYINPDNQDDIALLFTDYYKEQMQYVSSLGSWFIWDGKVWGKDITQEAFDRIRSLTRTNASYDQSLRKRLLTKASLNSSLMMAGSDRNIAGTIDQWDNDDWVLNTQSGIVNLKTGEMSSHDPKKYCSKITTSGAGGDCPVFIQFLNDITGNDQDLIDYFQRLFGYACTGSTKEHALIFFYGTGGNGKGTLLNTIASILNDYVSIAGMDVFTESRNERHSTELAAFIGARLVIAQETNEGRRWDEAKIKTLTGGDPITARFMRHDNFTYNPKFTLIIAGNHKPSIQSVDPAMKRRLHLVPFNITISKGQVDPDLSEKLEKESSGILQWMIEGSLEYSKKGLNPPKVVLDATDRYFQDENTIEQWVSDNCEIDPDFWDNSSHLFNSFKEYAKGSNQPYGTSKTFKSKMELLGYDAKKKNSGQGFTGLKLKEDNSRVMPSF